MGKTNVSNGPSRYNPPATWSSSFRRRLVRCGLARMRTSPSTFPRLSSCRETRALLLRTLSRPVTLSKSGAMKDSRLSVLSMVRPERRVSTLERVMEPEAEGEMVRVPEMVSQAEREVASAWERISMGLEPGFFHISYGQIGRYCMRGEIQLGFEAARTDRRDMSPRMSRRIWSILPIEPPYDGNSIRNG